jgi:hypothetical protein
MKQKRSSIQNPQFFPPELPSSVQIHRIIAFDLGQFDGLYGDEDVQHMTQYFTVLTIAQALQDLYGKSVEIIFQDILHHEGHSTDLVPLLCRHCRREPRGFRPY